MAEKPPKPSGVLGTLPPKRPERIGRPRSIPKAKPRAKATPRPRVVSADHGPAAVAPACPSLRVRKRNDERPRPIQLRGEIVEVGGHQRDPRPTRRSRRQRSSQVAQPPRPTHRISGISSTLTVTCARWYGVTFIRPLKVRAATCACSRRLPRARSFCRRAIAMPWTLAPRLTAASTCMQMDVSTQPFTG